ncbi:MAG: type II toxin-antitoxin system VapC family toxin [Verrucomicrobiota bacterium]|nr:type II toxin-antitoxin system VapC family toxin [Verrucomicrobiota bacterium]
MGGDEVKYLLDSSVWIMSSLREQVLPSDIQKIVGDANEVLGLSVFSLWEAAKKHQQGKLLLPMDLSHWLKAAVPHHVHVLPLTDEIIVESTRLPEFPVNDPADQLIVATARVHKLTLLTTDTKLKGYRHAKIHYFKPSLEKGRK